jgi:hypothetical protein
MEGSSPSLVDSAFPFAVYSEIVREIQAANIILLICSIKSNIDPYSNIAQGPQCFLSFVFRNVDNTLQAC